MTRRSTSSARAAMMLGALLGVCCGTPSGGDERPKVSAQGQQEGQAAGELPGGHPPVSDGTGFDMPPVPTASGSGASGLVWRAPAEWIEETPRNTMRRAQYSVPGSGGAAECVVFYFGPGQGGDAMSNAERWAGQFSQPDGRSPLEALQTEEIEVDGIPVLLVEIAGTYGGGMAMMGGPARNLEDHMLLGAVAEGPDANWFFKLTGPAATVGAQREAFEAMIHSLRRGG